MFIFYRYYENLGDLKSRNLDAALEQAMKEATADETFRKVKRMSYSGHTADEVRAQGRFSVVIDNFCKHFFSLLNFWHAYMEISNAHNFEARLPVAYIKSLRIASLYKWKVIDPAYQMVSGKFTGKYA